MRKVKVSKLSDYDIKVIDDNVDRYGTFVKATFLKGQFSIVRDGDDWVVDTENGLPLVSLTGRRVQICEDVELDDN